MKIVKGVCLPKDDTHFERHLLASETFQGRGTYQFEKIKAALQATPFRSAFIDIGAHVGLWSMVMQRYFTSVIAFEPVPTHISCFYHNLPGCAIREVTQTNLTNSDHHVQLLPCALGNSTGKITIDLVNDNSGNCRVETVQLEGITSLLEVDQFKLDEFVLPHFSLMKVDVEGYELEVIKGAEGHIRKYKPNIVVEQKPGHAKRYGHKDTEAVELLQKWGMKIKWTKSGDYCLAF